MRIRSSLFLAIAVLGLSSPLFSIGAQSSGPSLTVTSHGLAAFGTLIDTNNPNDPVFAFVGVNQSDNSGWMLFYSITDTQEQVNDSGFGLLPASSVSISGGSFNAGKAVITLNVNTCDVEGFTTSSGNCGPFDITFTELPPSVEGPALIEQHLMLSFPSFTLVDNGTVWSFAALETGTALGYSNTGGSAFANMAQGTSMGITLTISMR